jgi:Flp pilus assembly protein TadG
MPMPCVNQCTTPALRDPLSRRRRKGQALVEAGLFISLFVFMVLGIIEFGYAFMALNIITQATNAGARVGATLQVGTRGTCGAITDSSPVTGAAGTVRNQIGGAVTVNSVTLTQIPNPNTLCSGACCTFSGSNIPTVVVTVTGNIPYLFGLLGSGAHAFTRSVTFRDEGR